MKIFGSIFNKGSFTGFLEKLKSLRGNKSNTKDINTGNKDVDSVLNGKTKDPGLVSKALAFANANPAQLYIALTAAGVATELLFDEAVGSEPTAQIVNEAIKLGLEYYSSETQDHIHKASASVPGEISGVPVDQIFGYADKVNSLYVPVDRVAAILNSGKVTRDDVIDLRVALLAIDPDMATLHNKLKASGMEPHANVKNLSWLN